MVNNLSIIKENQQRTDETIMQVGQSVQALETKMIAFKKLTASVTAFQVRVASIEGTVKSLQGKIDDP